MIIDRLCQRPRALAQLTEPKYLPNGFLTIKYRKYTQFNILEKPDFTSPLHRFLEQKSAKINTFSKKLKK